MIKTDRERSSNRRAWPGILLLVIGAIPAAVLPNPGYAADAPPVVLARAKGVIMDVETERNTVMIEGNRFGFAPDVQMEIRGGYGNYQMLRSGMKVEVGYRRQGNVRTIVVLRQLPDSTVISQH